MLLITGVGSLIHIYSIGYMSHDPDRRKFFAYMNLFVAAMLLLVLGNSFVTLYAGWEGVGLASYLLIGFWSDRPAAATAAKKAFLMNRVGDVGLVAGDLPDVQGTRHHLVHRACSTGIGDLAASRPAPSPRCALLLLLGACGKSGQVPLQAWLPDAMEGPTPVSALIHAATMVTAGVYLIARCVADLRPDRRRRTGGHDHRRRHPAGRLHRRLRQGRHQEGAGVLDGLPDRLHVPGGRAGRRASTRSASCSCSPTASSRPACSSAPVRSCTRMNDDVDMRRFGGLARKLPITFVTMACGYLAIIGFPFFSGYFAKDPIIEAAFAAGAPRAGCSAAAALLGAGITAFYMTRLMIMTFFGDARWKELTIGRRTRLPPARIAAGDDRSDDHPGDRVGRRRGLPRARRTGWRTGWPRRSVQYDEPDPPVISASAITIGHAGRGGDRRRASPTCSSAAGRCR